MLIVDVSWCTRLVPGLTIVIVGDQVIDGECGCEGGAMSCHEIA